MKTDPTAEGVRYTLAEYCQSFDDGRSEDWAGLFCVDGRFSIDQLGELHGRDTIARFVGAATAALAEVGVSGVNHQTMNSMITVSGHRAESHSDWALAVPAEQGFATAVLGRYHDELVFTDRWRFQRRHITWFKNAMPPALDGALRPIFTQHVTA
jgi:hypothetical protein